MKFRFGLLPRVVLAIGLGVGCGFFFFPEWATRIALTFNDIFGQFLSFVIPLLILGLVAPGIADLGKTAGWLLAVTAALAYAFTLFSGFGTYLVGRGLSRAARRLAGRAARRCGRGAHALFHGSDAAAVRRHVGAGAGLRAPDWAWPIPIA